MQSRLSTIQKIINSLDAKAASRSRLSYAEFKNKVAYEFWLNPMEAIDAKLTDRLVYIRTQDSTALRGRSVSKEVDKLDPLARFLKNDNKLPYIILKDF